MKSCLAAQFDRLSIASVVDFGSFADKVSSNAEEFKREFSSGGKSLGFCISIQQASNAKNQRECSELRELPCKTSLFIGRLLRLLPWST